MTATFLTSASQPGDGSWLLRPRFQRRKAAAKRSFLHDMADNGAESGQVISTSEAALDGNNLSSLPRTIAIAPPLSTSSPLNFNAPPTQKALQPFTCLQPGVDFAYTHIAKEPYIAQAVMAIAPHLRRKEKQTPAATAAEQDRSAAEQACASDLAHTHYNVTLLPTPAVTQSSSIRARLERDHGVKFSDAKACRPALVTHTTSTEQGSPDMPHGQRTNESGDGQAVQNSHKIKAASTRARDASPVRDNARWCERERGRGGRPGGNSSRWPTAAEQRADPDRWRTHWSGSSGKASSDIDSAWADAGGDQTRRKPQGDSASYQLTDFNGDWAPAPVDWDSRPTFRDSQSTSLIQSWRSEVGKEMRDIDTTISLDFTVVPQQNIAANSGIQLDELAPHYWIPRVIESMSPQMFWTELKKSNTPKPCDEGDLIDVNPWWTLYQNAISSILRPYVHPTLQGPDPDETNHERIARENDFGSNHHTENRKRIERAKKNFKHEQRIKAQQKAEAIRKSLRTAENRHDESAIRPGVDLYLRGARNQDIKAICDIYNNHMSNSACVSELEPLTEQDMKLRLDQIRTSKLPFLVAYQRGAKLRGRKKRNPNGPFILPDKLVGFAYVDDYDNSVGLFRYTASLEVYVDNQSFMQGIAKCLMDKLLGLLDPLYPERGGYDVEGDEAYGIGAVKVVKNLVINVLFDRPEVLEWKGRWLQNWLGFKRVGFLDGIGEKNGKRVSLAIFQRMTGPIENSITPTL